MKSEESSLFAHDKLREAYLHFTMLAYL